MFGSIDERMQSFVEWHGQIPREARRLEDYEARSHADTWLRHHLGRGIIQCYVIGFQLEQRWWTLFFDRTFRNTDDGSEHWWIEAYDYSGESWSRGYCYSPTERQWRSGDLAGYGIRDGS